MSLDFSPSCYKVKIAMVLALLIELEASKVSVNTCVSFTNASDLDN